MYTVLLLWFLALSQAKPHHHQHSTIHGNSAYHHYGNPHLSTNNSVKIDSLIVGGVDASEGEFPFIASFRQDGYHFCGASLIESNGKFAILTAAHCTPNRVSTRYSVQLGAYLRTDSSTANKYSIISIVNHPHYNSNTLVNDIALLKLATNPTIEPGRVESVALPAQGEKPIDGDSCTVAGWGTTSSGGSLAMVLQKVVKPIVSDTECNALYSKAGYNIDASTMMCSGDTKDGGVDACQGDSGGPLVVYKNGQAIQHGVVSWGIGCADSRYPGVYAEVNYFRDWIDSTMRGF